MKNHNNPDKIIYALGKKKIADVNCISKDHNDVEIIDNLGDYASSSSKIIQDYQYNKVYTEYGYYQILSQDGYNKIKEVCVEPKTIIELGQHLYKNQFLFIKSGECKMQWFWPGEHENIRTTYLKTHSYFWVPRKQYHSFENLSLTQYCHIIMIEYSDVSKIYETDFVPFNIVEELAG